MFVDCDQIVVVRRQDRPRARRQTSTNLRIRSSFDRASAAPLRAAHRRSHAPRSPSQTRQRLRPTAERTPSGDFQRSAALADAVQRGARAAPAAEIASPNPADLHIKSATSGDIDNDGDVNLWVRSGGGANVEEHFMVNNGDGTFTVDRDNRATRPVLHA